MRPDDPGVARVPLRLLTLYVRACSQLGVEIIGGPGYASGATALHTNQQLGDRNTFGSAGSALNII